MKKIITVVGARPQFVKAAMMSRELESSYNEILIHTGQHYDTNMSAVFFDELAIKQPKYNLGISRGTHGEMTGRMMIELEKIFLDEKPDMIIVYGDTNTTMAAALVAVKLAIPVVHIEGGNNRGSLANPEDVNRIVSDHVATINFACVESAMINLEKENLLDRSYFVGDSMYDAFVYYSNLVDLKSREDIFDFKKNRFEVPERYYLMTCHRQENARDDGGILQIMSAAQELDAPVVFPVHPRNHERVNKIKQEYNMDNLLLIEPVGYLTSIALEKNAIKILTDSGGVQREAFFANKQCVTVFDYAWWPETLKNGMNRLAKPEKEDILEKLRLPAVVDEDYKPFGCGDACKKMKKIIDEFFAKMDTNI